MCPNQHSAAFMCQLHDASSLLAKISLQVGWIGAFQVGLDIRLDWISCDHLQRVKCGDCIKFEAIFQFFDIGYRRVSGNWLMMLFHLKGGGIWIWNSRGMLQYGISNFVFHVFHGPL